MKANFALFALLLMVCAVFACSEETPDPLKTTVPNIPAPTNVTATVGATAITLTWDEPAGSSYDEFAIYRRDINDQNFTKLGNANTSPYADATVKTGDVYVYQVAGVVGGIEGKRSKSLTAAASFFGVTINDGQPFTNARVVQLSLTAPDGTQLVRYGQTMDLSGEPWVSYSGFANLEVDAGDGLKTVYAQFTDVVGLESSVVSDDITLDTQAQLQSGSYSPTSPLAPGTTISFSVTTVGNETDGSVSITIDGLAPIEARDEGTNGDGTAGDGVYERDFLPPLSFRTKDARATATFTDRAGNRSDAFEFANRLTYTDPPPAVTLSSPTDATDSTMTLSWSKSNDLYFTRYDLYRDTSPGVNLSSTRVTQISDAGTLRHTDMGLKKGTTYYYRVFVVNDIDESTPSNEVNATTTSTSATAIVPRARLRR